MTNVSFVEFQCSDDRRMLERDEALRYILAFSGNHNIDSIVFSEFIDSGDFDEIQGWGSASGGTLTMDGGGESTLWYMSRLNQEVEGSFVTRFTKTGNYGGFNFMCSESSYTGYFVYWTPDSVGAMELNNTERTKLVEFPCEHTTDEAEVMVGAWLLSYTEIDRVDDVGIGLWFDNKLLLSFCAEYNEDGNYMGFSTYGSNTATYSNFSVLDAHSILDWASVDPGETAASGISRVLAYTTIRPIARYDGSIRIYDETRIESGWSLEKNRVISDQRKTDVFAPSHLRSVGALHEADSYRLGNQGHIVVIDQDPNALTESETASKGERRHRTLEGESREASLQIPLQPFLEPGDVFEYDGITWKVQSFNYSSELKGGKAPVVTQGLSARRKYDE